MRAPCRSRGAAGEFRPSLAGGRSEHHVDLVLRAVVRQGNARFAGTRRTVEAGLGDPATDSVRVVHGNSIDGAAMAIRDREARPLPRDARIDMESGAPLPEAENRLEARAVEPARRARVPGPSTTSHVGWLGTDVGGHCIRLHPDPLDAGGVARMPDGVEQPEQAGSLFAFSEIGQRHDRPDRGVGVLPAVLPDPRRISFYVPWV